MLTLGLMELLLHHGPIALLCGFRCGVVVGPFIIVVCLLKAGSRMGIKGMYGRK